MNRTEINRLLTSIKTWVNPISEQNCHFKKAKIIIGIVKKKKLLNEEFPYPQSFTS